MKIKIKCSCFLWRVYLVSGFKGKSSYINIQHCSTSSSFQEFMWTFNSKQHLDLRNTADQCVVHIRSTRVGLKMFYSNLVKHKGKKGNIIDGCVVATQCLSFGSDCSLLLCYWCLQSNQDALLVHL